MKKIYRQSGRTKYVIVIFICPFILPICPFSVEDILESAESDKLLLSLLEPVKERVMDEENYKERAANRHPTLFGLYPLPGREEALENRTPGIPPSEHEGIKLLVKISELRSALSIICVVIIFMYQST